MSKSKQFISSIRLIANSVDKNRVKEVIGDSKNNHRTLTVSQLIRFLIASKSTKLWELGQSLDAVYSMFKSEIGRSPGRTDAVDINEFLRSVTTSMVVYGRHSNSIKQRIGRVVNF